MKEDGDNAFGRGHDLSRTIGTAAVSEGAKMITGLHAMLYSPDADAVRAFLRDVLGFHHVDAGHGWLIFRAPPTEMATHPTEPGKGHWDLALMCDDIDATLGELKAKGVACTEVREIGWGRASTLTLPDGQDLMIYQPLYQTAI